MIYRESELYHYGILGMKWGKRKARNISTDHKELRDIKKKHVSEMSNEELRKLNKRMDLEQNYHRLNPSAVQRGLKFAGVVVNATGTILALESNSDRLIKLGQRFIKR